MKISILIAILTMSSGLFAQEKRGNSGERKAQLEGMRVAHITKQMALTPEDAQVFWPIVNSYESESKELRKEYKDHMQSGEEFTDEEARMKYKKRIDVAQKKLDMTKELIRALEKEFTANQILDYLLAEESFKREILSRVKERMHENQSK